MRADYEAGLNSPVKSLTGTVTTIPDGNGIANATVTLTTMEGDEIASTTTDINGNYTFTDIVPGVHI